MTWVVAAFLAAAVVICGWWGRWVAATIGFISGVIGLGLVVYATSAPTPEPHSALEGLGLGMAFLGGAGLMVIACVAVFAGLINAAWPAEEPDTADKGGTDPGT